MTRLASDGWNVAWTTHPAYDDRMPWGADASMPEALVARVVASGGQAMPIAVDLADAASPERAFDAVGGALGPVQALVLSHCESVDGTIADTTLDSFDRHFAVNARATWLLVREFAGRFAGERGSGRIVAFTSDHVVGNLAYGASKAALDRIVLAAASEFASLGITANVVNPGATDTGWMSDDLAATIAARTAGGRVGLPGDAAALVAFLCSAEGGWINGQLLHSDGGRLV